jgi:phospholipase A-2-activating protein
VIDLGRLVTGYCPKAFTAAGVKERFFEALFKAAEWDRPWPSPLPKYRETNTLLLFRALANAFQDGAPVAKEDWVKNVRLLYSSQKIYSLFPV